MEAASINFFLRRQGSFARVLKSILIFAFIMYKYTSSSSPWGRKNYPQPLPVP
nr:MAG TPA: hypothetical protein [Caudoviricetes sp.]